MVDFQFPLGIQLLKSFAPDPLTRGCPWTPLGAPPPDPRFTPLPRSK